MAPDKKNAKRLGAHLVFVDESGFLLIPSVRKTWAPIGRTPVIRHRYRHDRISVIGGLSISPQRTRLGLYFRFHEKNIQHQEVCEFLLHLLKHLRGPIIVLWDNGRIHKGEPIREICRRYPRLRLEALPPYAPELNPIEGVWAQAKETMANGCPDDQLDLMGDLVVILGDLDASQRRLRQCVHQSDLPIFLP